MIEGVDEYVYFSDGRGKHIAGLARLRAKYAALNDLSAPADVWQPRRRRWNPVEAFVVDLLGTGDWQSLPAAQVEQAQADMARRIGIEV